MDGLNAAGNTVPVGLWSDRQTMWVADSDDRRIYAYTLSIGVRDTDKEFRLHSDNGNPAGMWSDGQTIWVADIKDGKIYAYDLSSGDRNSDEDFNGLGDAGNDKPFGIWSDSETMWVSDSTDRKIYAYNLSTKAHDSAKEFSGLTDAGQSQPYGIWSDGLTMWVSEYGSESIYAYNMESKAHNIDLDYNTLESADNERPFALWSDGLTMWVTDDDRGKVYSYHAPPSSRHIESLEIVRDETGTPIATVTSSHPGPIDLTLHMRYRQQGTDTWAPTQTAMVTGPSSVSFNLTNLIPNRMYEVQASFTSGFGANTYVERLWDNSIDIDLAGDNTHPQGIWTNGTTIWVVDVIDAKLYAYNLNSKARDRSKDLDLVDENAAPQGIYSNGNTIWISDRNTNMIFAYEMANGAPTGNALPSKNLTLPDLEWGAGLMGDGTTLYAIAFVDEDILAYNISANGTFGERVTSKDLHHIFHFRLIRGLSVHGDKFFTVDGNMVYARIFGGTSHGLRLVPQDFEVPSGVSPWGITSHDDTLWVTDARSDSLLAFSVPTGSGGTIWNLILGESFNRNGSAAIYVKNPDSETINLWARMRKLPNGNWGTTKTASTFEDLAFAIFPQLDRGDLYELQASTSSSFTDSTTVGATYRSPSESTLVKRHIAKDVVPARRGAAPWIWETYRGMRDRNPSVSYQENGGVVLSSCVGRAHGHSLGWCGSTSLASDYEHEAVTIHEMAHYYTISSGVPARGAEASAMAWLHAVEIGEGGTVCPIEELLADSMRDHLIPGASGYFMNCNVTGDRPSDATRAAFRSIAQFKIPNWFDNTFAKYGLPYSTRALDGYSIDYDLEKVADEVVKMPTYYRPAVIYQFRNSFGGYCDDERAWNALTNSSSSVRNPWRAGGCVPQQVRSLSVTVDTADDELDITWDKPAYDGGITLDNYTVSWRTFNQEFDDSRRMVITDTDRRIVSVPLPAAKWEVQVEAVSSAGAGPPAIQGAANPPIITAISAENVSGSPGSVTVTVTTENFDSSIGSIYLRHRPIGSSDPWTTSGHTAAASLTTTLTDVRQNIESIIQASLTPSFPSSTTLGTTITTPAGDNSELMPLSVSPTDIYEFTPGRHNYFLGFGSSVSQITVNYSVFQPGSTVSASHTDAGPNEDGHQIDIGDGLTAFILTVESADTTATTTYTINVGRSVSTAFGWKAQDDLNRLDPDIPPHGITYVDSLYRIASPDANNLAACSSEFCWADFAIQLQFENSAPKHLTDDGMFVFVTDTRGRQIYVYDAFFLRSVTDAGFSLHSDNDDPQGIWQGPNSTWVADSTDRKIYAYRRSDGEHEPKIAVTLAADNDSPAGIWSDGATIWVVDNTDAKIYAYDLFTSERKPVQDFNTLTAAGNTDPSGLASDGTTLAVSDLTDRKVYTYNMPASQNANLQYIQALGAHIMGRELGDFIPRKTNYTGVVAVSVDRITFVAEVEHNDATYTITPSDDDDMMDGHQVDLALGANIVTFTVTAEDGTTKNYVLNVFKGSAPTAPTNLTGTPRHAEAILAWDKADSTTAVTKYQLRYKKTADMDWDPDWTDIEGSGADTVSHTIGGLDNDVAYTFELRAKNPVGESSASSVSVTPRPRPQAPTNLSASPSNQKATLNWNVPSDSTITHYEYRVSADDGTTWDPDWTTITGSDASTATYMVTSLTNDMAHLMQIRAVNPYGESDAIGASATPVARPAAPANFIASGGGGQAVLTWDDPDNPSITKYQYRVSGDGGTNWDPDWKDISGSGASTTSYTVTPLDNGTEYTFEVRAVNPVGNGAGARASATPWPLPLAPTNLDASPDNRQVTLSWDDPNNVSITKYQHRVSSDGGSNWSPDWTDISGSGASTTSHTITPLNNGTEYTFEVRAVNPTDSGPSSRVAATPNTLPSAPASFNTAPDNRQVTLSWDNPSDSSITKYQYRVSDDGGTDWDPDWKYISGSGASTASYTVTPLDNGTEYTFEVRAVNPTGNGAVSRDTATPNPRPVAPASFDASPANTQVTLNWNNPSDSSITKYQYRVSSDGGTSWSPDWTDISESSASTTSHTVTPLDNGTEYTFEVRAVNPTGNGAVSRDTATPNPRPAAPANFIASGGVGRAILTWTDPSDSSVIKYQYRVSADGGTNWDPDWTDIQGSGASTTSHTLTPLDNGTEYTFQIRAESISGDGLTSQDTATPRLLPLALANLRAQPSDEQVALTWDNLNNDSIEKYQYRHRKMTEADWNPDWTDIQGSKANTVSLTLDDLDNREEYIFEIRAVNSSGGGTASRVTATPQTLPPAPTGLSVQPDDASANLSWLNPNDSLIQKYQYRVSANGGTNWDPDWTDIPGSTASTTSFTAMTLQNAVEHTFEVRAVNAAGAGAASRASAIPNPLPPPVGNFGAKSEDTFVTLSWNSLTVASAVTKFQIRYRETTETAWDPDWTDISGSATTYTAANLTNGTEYTFEIRTVNSRGEGPVASITAIPGPPEVPTWLTATIKDKQVSLSWNNPGDNTITSWQYRYREFDSSEWKLNWTAIPDSDDSTTSYTVTGLQNGADYTFEVRAVNHVGEGPAASVSVISVGLPTIPRQPENVQVESQDSGLTVYWTRPREDIRAPVASYILRYREVDATDWTNVSQSVDARSISGEITGLTNRRHYEVQVAAVNRIGTSPWVSAIGTPQGTTEPPPPEGLPEISVGPLAAYWTDVLGSKTLHPDSINSNGIQNSCTGEESFRIFWAGPDEDSHSNKVAAEWAAHVKTWGGAGEVTYIFKEDGDNADYVGMYGTVNLNGDARLTIKVRGRFGDQGWGEWSPPVGLFCFAE